VTLRVCLDALSRPLSRDPLIRAACRLPAEMTPRHKHIRQICTGLCTLVRLPCFRAQKAMISAAGLHRCTPVPPQHPRTFFQAARCITSKQPGRAAEGAVDLKGVATGSVYVSWSTGTPTLVTNPAQINQSVAGANRFIDDYPQSPNYSFAPQTPDPSSVASVVTPVHGMGCSLVAHECVANASSHVVVNTQTLPAHNLQVSGSMLHNISCIHKQADSVYARAGELGHKVWVLPEE